MLMTTTTLAPASYAAQRNARFNTDNSTIISPAQRWRDTYAIYDKGTQGLIDHMLDMAKDEFRRRYPDTKAWTDLELVESREVSLSQLMIDSTMQRQLDIFWVLHLLNRFSALKVMPIQIYLDEDGNHLAWDGQHTLILLWIIATQVLCLEPDTVKVPVNIYKSTLKSQMRNNFISLNSSDGKKMLDPIDIFEQQVFGVRIDGSTDSVWREAERKQQHVESHNLFLTAKKFGDTHMPGAISRINEVIQLGPDTVGHLMRYLSRTTQGQRPVVEKEMVMMSKYLDHCKAAKIKVDDQYVDDLAKVNLQLFKADFEPTGPFWAKAAVAYKNWHDGQKVAGYIPRDVRAAFKNEPLHGMPFYLAQLRKSFAHKIPANTSNSPFWPAAEDLF